MSLIKSVTTFGGFTLLSRITGFLRDVTIANFLGAGMVSDAFFVAMRMPNLFRNLFAEGAFTSAFVPMLSHKLVSDSKESAFKFAAKAICVLSVFVVLLVIITEIFMPYVVYLMAPGFINDTQKTALAVNLTRITFPFLLFISIVSFQSGILNSLGKFAAPASAPIILNITMILSVLIFVPFGANPAYSLSIAITVSGIIQFVYLYIFLRRQNVRLPLQINTFKALKDKEIKTLFKRMGPGIFGAGIYQVNMVVDLILVSLLGTGAISWIYYANRLNQLPIGVVGAAIGVVLLPVLSQSLKSGHEQEAKRNQDKAIRFGLFLAIPSSVFLMSLATPIINILFERGKFTSYETLQTAPALIAYSFGLPLFVMGKAFAPNFFARGDTKTPVKYSTVVLIANMLFSIVLMHFFGHVGIATASSISALISVWLYVRGLKKRNFWSFSKTLKIEVCKILLSSTLMGCTMKFCNYILNSYYTDGWLSLDFYHKAFLFVLICGCGGTVFLISSLLLKNQDVKDLFNLLLKRKQRHAG